MARTPVGGPDRNAQKADFQYPASVCIVRGPASLQRSGLACPLNGGRHIRDFSGAAVYTRSMVTSYGRRIGILSG